MLIGCNKSKNQNSFKKDKLSVIFDTDANNELDDQHALAYLLFNGQIFNVKGITVNATYNGGNIDEHYAEAKRVSLLCNSFGKIPLLKGANGSFKSIKKDVNLPSYDGVEAVDFIIKQAKMHTEDKLIIIAVGKLTNIALALKKEPSIQNNIRLVWLGSNYPESGEYNLVNDIPAMNYLLESDIHFEMVTVRYGKSSGTDAVRITKDEVQSIMPGLGPVIEESVIGRHGGDYNNFGDYSVSLFDNIDYDNDPPSRALFDMAAVAIVKNSNWAKQSIIPSPIMKDGIWIDQPENSRKILLWEYFNKDQIMKDFYSTLENYKIN
jgi:hypothetical protein